MFRRLLVLGFCLFAAAPGLATEFDYSPYLAHLSDIECLHFTYDCGGYYDLGVKGTFAYALSENNGLQVIDVSDPLAPVNRGYLGFGHSAWANHLALQDHYAFVARQAPSAIAIVDVDDADAPVVHSLLPLASIPLDVAMIGRKMCVSTVDGQLSIFDTNVPTQPQFVTSVASPIGPCRELILDGSRLVAAGDAGLAVYDVSSPAAPLLLGSLPMSGGVLHAMSAQNNLVLAAQGSQTRILDVSNPQLIDVIGAIPGWAYGLLLVDGEAWIGTENCWGNSNLDIYDLTDPAQPELRYQDGYDLRGGLRAMVASQGLVYAGEYICWCAGEWPGFHVYQRGEMPLPQPLITFNPGSARCVLGRGNVLYVGMAGSISAYDLAAPAAPALLGSVAGAPATVRLQSAGDRLLALGFVDWGQPRRLSLHDLGTGWAPVPRGSVDVSWDARAMAPTGAHILVAGGAARGLDVVDASDPDAPAVVATHYPGQTITGVTTADGFAAVAAGAEIRLLDVSDPLAPVLLGVIPADPDHFREELQLLDLGGRRYLLGAHNHNQEWYEYIDAAEIWDITDPAQPVRALRVQLLATDTCEGLVWRDGVLYIHGSTHLTVYRWSGVGQPHGLIGRANHGDYQSTSFGSASSTEGAVVGIAGDSRVIVWPLQARPLTAVSPDPVPAPTAMSLQVSPNPFNPRTRLVFTLAAAGRADLAVYDLAGRMVRRLENGELPAGEHVRIWSGDDDAGRSLPSGTYVARLATAAGVETRKLVLVR